jgi:uncharacterized protein (UPF0332 family)
MKMSYERWLKDRLIKSVVPDHEQITRQLNRASKDLRTAEAVSSIDRAWSFTIAYHAMIRAGRAFMFSKGDLPTTLNPHKTIVEFTRVTLGSRYEDLILHFDRMRRMRHDFIYDSENHTTEREALAAIKTAQDLIRGIMECLEAEYSKKLI